MTSFARDEPPVVQLIRVSKRFDGAPAPAVREVSLAIRRGEFFSILGPSGCGKTTTLRLIAGFEAPDPDGGEIRLLGEAVNDRRPYQRPVGMVFQSYALFPHLPVGENVAFGLRRQRRPRAEIAKRVREALALVQLDPDTFARRMPAQLSGGERQRVALARALVLAPPILLLDEPLAAIDLKLRKAMQLEVKALNRRLGITFVYVTHDQQEALTMSDRIAVMDRGRVAQIGTPAEIYQRPRTEFVATFIGEANIFEGVAAPGNGSGDAPASLTLPTGETVRIPPHRGVAGEARAQAAVRPEWIAVERIDPAKAPAPDQPPPATNVFRGVVDELVYLGETVHLLVRLPSGRRIRAALRGGRAEGPETWTAGTAVQLTWRADDVHLLETG